MPSKKRKSAEEVWAWAESLAHPDEPTVLACAAAPARPNPRAIRQVPAAREELAAAQVFVGALSAAHVASLAERLERIAALERAEMAGPSKRASSRG